MDFVEFCDHYFDLEIPPRFRAANDARMILVCGRGATTTTTMSLYYLHQCYMQPCRVLWCAPNDVALADTIHNLQSLIDQSTLDQVSFSHRKLQLNNSSITYIPWAQITSHLMTRPDFVHIDNADACIKTWGELDILAGYDHSLVLAPYSLGYQFHYIPTTAPAPDIVPPETARQIFGL